MVRISDILGRSQQPKEPGKERQEGPPSPFSQIPSGISPKIPLADKNQTQALYQDMLSVTIELIDKIRQQKQRQTDLDKIRQILSRLIEQLSAHNDYLFSISYFSSVDDYLPVHLLNTCIYSLGLGVSLGLDKSKLEELGIACLFYDIGFLKVQDLIKKGAKLSHSEFEKVKSHTQDTADLLKDISGLPETVLFVIAEHHERYDASGYPRGLKAAQIHEFSQIVGLCDTYEASTHNRPHEKKTSAFEAMKQILQQKQLFDPRILKAFIDTMGIYPVETWVELNNGESGKVTSVNRISILRPIVNIYLDSQGERLTETRMIDLSKEVNLFIKKALTEQNLA